MRTRIAAGVVVASLAVVSLLHAQTDYLDGWSSDPIERSGWVETPAVSVVDQVAVARYLAEAGVDQESYRLAFTVTRRLDDEGASLADLAGPTAALSTLRVVGIVVMVNLVLFAIWNRFNPRAS